MAARGSLGQPGEPNLRYPTIELNEAESWQWSPAERLSRCFGVQPLRQTRQIDDDALMCAGADRFCLVRGADGELDAAAVDVRHLGLADDPHPERRRARWRTSTRVPTALSPASRYGLSALSAAFSMTMIMTGVANTGGSAVSLN